MISCNPNEWTLTDKAQAALVPPISARRKNCEDKICFQYANLSAFIFLADNRQLLGVSWTLWRNGSASDSRSEGCTFQSSRGHNFSILHKPAVWVSVWFYHYYTNFCLIKSRSHLWHATIHSATTWPAIGSAVERSSVDFALLINKLQASVCRSVRLYCNVSLLTRQMSALPQWHSQLLWSQQDLVAQR